MRRVLEWTAVLAVALLMSLPAARAQEGERPVRRDPPPRPGAMLREVLNRLDLSAEQKTQVDAALEKFAQEMRAEMEANRAKFQELEKQMREAREARDEAKLRELREQAGKLRETQEAKLNELIEKEIRPILNEEQNKKLAEALERARPGPRPPVIRPELLLRNAEQLGLSAEQKEQIETLARKFREEMTKLEGGERTDENARARRELAEKFQKDLLAVLSEEQRAKLPKLLPPPPRPEQGGPLGRVERVLRELELNEQQKSAIADLRKALEEQLKSAKEDERPQLMRKFVNDVKELLTAEQKERFEKLLAPPPPRERPRLPADPE